jgi:hypothetical protein
MCNGVGDRSKLTIINRRGRRRYSGTPEYRSAMARRLRQTVVVFGEVYKRKYGVFCLRQVHNKMEDDMDGVVVFASASKRCLYVTLML